MHQASNAVDDWQLLTRARAGDRGAVAELYSTHIAAARRLGAILVGPDAADDLADEAFTRVLEQFRAGHGPSRDFRSYLMTTIRNRYRDLVRTGAREEPTSDKPWIWETPVPEPTDVGDAAMRALQRLQPRWQQVIWQLEVEGRTVPELAERLRISPSAVSALAYRARRGLRTAYFSVRG